MPKGKTGGRLIDLMPTRADQLAATLTGWSQTGVPLVQSIPSGFAPAGFSDDPGLYLVVPWIARTFGLGLIQATDAFFISALVIAAVAGIIGNWRLCTTNAARVYATAVILALTAVAYRIGDVYILTFAMPAAFVPWILHLLRGRAITKSSLALMVLLGASAAFSHLVRSHSGTAVVIFALTLTFFCDHASFRRRLAVVALLVAGALLVAVPFSMIVQDRDAFLLEQDSHYSTDRTAHPFWHSVYIGLGYIDNPYVAEYRDEVAIATVRNTSPDAEYLSRDYESILRREVFRIARTDPWFMVRQLCAKLLAIGYKLLLFMNIALFALLFARPSRAVSVAFLLAMSFQSLPALLTIPHRAYMLGLYTFTALFAIVCVDHAWPTVREKWAARTASAQRD